MTSLFCFALGFNLSVMFVYSSCSFICVQWFSLVSARGIERVWPLGVKRAPYCCLSQICIKVTLFSMESHRPQVTLLFYCLTLSPTNNFHSATYLK